MERHQIDKRRIEVRQESKALLTGRFSVDEALALVRLRESWQAALPRECGTAAAAPRVRFAGSSRTACCGRRRSTLDEAGVNALSPPLADS